MKRVLPPLTALPLKSKIAKLIELVRSDRTVDANEVMELYFARHPTYTLLTASVPRLGQRFTVCLNDKEMQRLAMRQPRFRLLFDDSSNVSHFVEYTECKLTLNHDYQAIEDFLAQSSRDRRGPLKPYLKRKWRGGTQYSERVLVPAEATGSLVDVLRTPRPTVKSNAKDEDDDEDEDYVAETTSDSDDSASSSSECEDEEDLEPGPTEDEQEEEEEDEEDDEQEEKEEDETEVEGRESAPNNVSADATAGPGLAEEDEDCYVPPTQLSEEPPPKKSRVDPAPAYLHTRLAVRTKGSKP